MSKLHVTGLRGLIAVACISLFVSGCVNTPSAHNLPPAPKNVVPASIDASGLEPYRVQIGDVIAVKILLNPELNDEVTVRPDGLISTVVAQDVRAYGRTTAELQKDLEEQYDKELVKPEIAVLIRSFAPTRIYVTGEVAAPGEFVTIGPSLTLMQAIARAGGVKNSAGTSKIIILRRGAGEKPVAYSASYNEAASGIDPSSDVRLAPYDVVYVPRSDIGDVYLNFNQYVQQFVPVVFGVNYQVNPTTTIK